MRFPRRKLLSTALFGSVAGAAAYGYMRYLEPTHLEISHVSLRDIIPFPLKILHLSDFHASRVVGYDYIDQCVERALLHPVDLTVITGDFITWSLEEEERYLRILKKLTAAAPCYACLGNHDGGKWAGSTHGYPTTDAVRSLLQKAQIELLFNESKKLRFDSGELTLCGLGDLWAEELKPHTTLNKSKSEDETVLVLAHNPDSKGHLKPYAWDLMLCGHTHGGQLRVPLFGWTPFAPVQDRRFVEGLHRWDGRYFYITRGVGNLHGMRFNCRPQISLLES